jgi:tryptophan synthase alpha subunit
VRQYADGAIVASALVDLLEHAPASDRAAMAARFIREMKAACRGPGVAAEPGEAP